jgi:hypothetical protein
LFFPLHRGRTAANAYTDALVKHGLLCAAKTFKQTVSFARKGGPKQKKS